MIIEDSGYVKRRLVGGVTQVRKNKEDDDERRPRMKFDVSMSITLSLSEN